MCVCVLVSKFRFQLVSCVCKLLAVETVPQHPTLSPHCPSFINTGFGADGSVMDAVAVVDRNTPREEFEPGKDDSASSDDIDFSD